MKLGIHMDLRNPPGWSKKWTDHYRQSLELVVEAERLGAASVWLSEHHLFDDGYLPQPLTFGAAIAARTSSIRIGTAIMQGTLRPTMHLAEEAAVLDIISGGRLELGLGTGYRKVEYDGYGREYADRHAALLRQLAELPRMWAGGSVTPPPVQQPIPLWGGFRGPKGAHAAGELGIGLVAGENHLLEPYMQGLAAGGHDPGSARWAALMFFVLADDPERTAARLAPFIEYQWESYRRHGVQGTAAEGAVDAAPKTLQLARSRQGDAWIEVLTPEQAYASLTERFAGLPMHHVFCWASVGGMPDDIAERHIELMFNELAPIVDSAG